MADKGHTGGNLSWSAALHGLEDALHLHRCGHETRDARSAGQAASSDQYPDPQATYGDAPYPEGSYYEYGADETRSHEGRFHDAPGRPIASCSVLTRLLRRWEQFRCPRIVRRIATISGALVVLTVLGCGALFWRLSSGPIALDIFTPWLTAAIEENFGNAYRVEVGGTILERDERGRARVRIQNIVVRDRNGVKVASAPKAEVKLSGASLLSGKPRAETIDLVDAELALLVETDGKLRVFAGADKQILATGPVLASAESASAPLFSSSQPVPPRPTGGDAAASLGKLLSWIDAIGSAGLDGGELSSVGLKRGTLLVEDQRNGERSKFEKINLSLTRPHAGEVLMKLEAENGEKPWTLTAAIKPSDAGRRAIAIEARKVSLRDLMLALRIDAGQPDCDLPISASVRAEIAADGAPQLVAGKVVMGPGTVGEGDAQTAVERVELNLDFDATRGTLQVPLQVMAGGARLTMMARIDVPHDKGGPWSVAVGGGSLVIAPLTENAQPLTLNRVALRGRYAPGTGRIDVDQVDVGGQDVGIAASGSIDISSSDPRLALGFAARNMSVASFKQLWPGFLNARLRGWIIDRLSAGQMERIEIATNGPLTSFTSPDIPVPDDGLSIEVVTTGATLRPIDGLPALRDADLTTRIKGRTVSVTVGKAAVEMPSGRRLTLTNGAFEVADTFVKKPMSKVRGRVDGPVPAAAELLGMDRLRDASSMPLDPSTSRGNVAANIVLAMPVDPELPPGSANYAITADISNFAVDKFVMSQKVESQMLRVTANQQGYQVKGDVKIGGLPATVDYKKPRGDGDAEVRLAATLDDVTRTRLGFDLGNALTGSVPIRMGGRVSSAPDGESRYAIEADLTQARVENLLPGWVKASGKATRAAFTYSAKNDGSRFEDVLVEGSGVLVKGAFEIDGDGNVVAANFPTFGFSDGDKASVKADRTSDGMLKVVMRGDVYDGRSFVKATMSAADPKQKKSSPDVDVDVKIGAVAGFNGEALRGFDLKLVRRGGIIRGLGLNAKLGTDTPLKGDLRGKAGARQVVYLETNDAGSFFRFTDTYAKMYGGQMWVAMDPPTADRNTPQEGILNIRDFQVRGEAALDQVASTPGQRGGVEFSRMRVEFARSSGALTIKDGVVRGPLVGATVDGKIDYASNEVRMRGTFVPLYGINNAFGQIPIVGLFFGGSNEGLVGVTYEVVGPPGAPILRVNPISMVAPGLFRKFFEFPSANASERFTDTTVRDRDR